MKNKIKVELIEGYIKKPMSDFKITRAINGEVVGINLTEHEVYLVSAYHEDSCYMEDVKIGLRLCREDDEVWEREELNGYTVDEILSDESLMGEIFAEYKRNRNKYDMDCDDAISDAISDALSRNPKA